ncbi:MAG TPA: acyl-CoA dehydrogenase family protein [Solirubrobacteraceae bacterium]|jgi:putative acyl-CoA dehydrogenase|nr:acyl-CoA dehydrogenase family protein [Solirubrobacteraceae bacterium]
MATTTTPPATATPLNQPPPREGLDEYATNAPLVEAVERHDAGWADERLRTAGRLVGEAAFQRWSADADRHPPVLVTHDRAGRRIDEVEYHPSYHAVIGRAVEHGAHSLAWTDPRPGAHVARAAMFMLFAQVEPGHACPTSMTHSAVPALRAEPGLAAEWEPRLTSTRYDPVLAPPQDKAGALCGMAMTEKQGGSDLRQTTTAARPVDAGAGEYELTGHKWFCSAPMCDLFLTLARTDEGISCFALPRVLPDGTRNGFRVERLKDKLGNRSNASSEVVFEAARARLVGEPGRGIPTIIEMVSHARLDCILGTTAGMRHAVAEAAWYAAHRVAFGRRLAEQPLMENVLADLCLEAEAATAVSLRLARAYDADADDRERAFRRLATAVSKYWVCKRGPRHAFEAMECLGGNGYVETFPVARRYREQPITSIWEGSGNVICLDVLRALVREPHTLDALLAELDESAGADRRLDAYVDALRAELRDGNELERRARRLTERMALALQASLLVRHAPRAVADAFCAARLDGAGGAEYGTLPAGASARAIVARHAPEVA